MTMSFRGLFVMTGGTLLGAAAGVGAMWYATHYRPPAVTHTAPAQAAEVDDQAEAPQDSENAVTVNTIHPKRDKAFTVTIHQLASVEPYYQANLRARAA